jgi:hypothetical protein
LRTNSIAVGTSAAKFNVVAGAGQLHQRTLGALLSTVTIRSEHRSNSTGGSTP